MNIDLQSITPPSMRMSSDSRDPPTAGIESQSIFMYI